MIKPALLLPLMLALEFWAYKVFRDHPLSQPAYFNVILLLVQVVMTWAGIESARWLLRRSVVSKAKGPFEDHVRLWVWIGPFGGLWLTAACLLGGWLAESPSFGPLAGFVVVAHFSGGAVLWTLGSAWVLPGLMADPDTTLRDWFLAIMGFMSHVLGFTAYYLVFPALRTPLKLVHPLAYLVGTALIFCYLAFYVYAAVLTWTPFLAMLKPPEPAPPGAPERSAPEE
jgi:hypothetical protein